MWQGTQHSKKLFLNQKYIYENTHWQLEKDKGFMHGTAAECGVYLFLVYGCNMDNQWQLFLTAMSPKTTLRIKSNNINSLTYDFC